MRAIDQRRLPFSFEVVAIASSAAMATAIADMTVRGAGLIGAAAGYGMALAAGESVAEGTSADEVRRLLATKAEALRASRPTAVNLAWAVDRQLAALGSIDDAVELVAHAWATADAIAEEDAAACEAIGRHGLPLLAAIHERTGRPVNVLTHCNAGWLAFVDFGTATAPIYAAHDAGIPVHVWVDETRPRNQGRGSPPGSSASTACPTRWWPTTRAATSCSTARSTSSSPAPTAPARRATWPTRSAPTSRRWPRTTTTSPSTSPSRRRPSTGRSTTAWAEPRSSPAAPRRCCGWRAWTTPAEWSRCASPPRAPLPPTTPST
ncbi:MAG: hypothetical protein R2711_10805 [Acidimicrobiales bacterium]